MTSSPPAVIAILTAILVLVVAVVFDGYCLRDLDQTADVQLLYFPRQTWIIIICLATPVGGVAYLTFGKLH